MLSYKLMNLLNKFFAIFVRKEEVASGYRDWAFHLWLHRFCITEQATLSALLQSTKLTNAYLTGSHS